jgi:hydroxyacylglutathione hydrolase
MQIETLPWRDNYIHLLMEGETAAVVDPGSAEPVLTRLRDLGVRHLDILLTHHHLDHTGGCPGLLEGFRSGEIGGGGREPRAVAGCGCPWGRVIGPDDARLPWLDVRVVPGQRIEVVGVEFEVIAVPGHTRSHVAYGSREAGVVFTGDALFNGGCGRLFEGTAATLWESLCRLRDLPGDTRVYSGHDYTMDNLEFALEVDPSNDALRARVHEIRERVRRGEPTVPSTMAEEKATNPFLRADDPRLAALLQMRGRPAVEVFAELRRRKDEW